MYSVFSYISDFTWKYEVLTFPLGISIAATSEYFAHQTSGNHKSSGRPHSLGLKYLIFQFVMRLYLNRGIWCHFRYPGASNRHEAVRYDTNLQQPWTWEWQQLDSSQVYVVVGTCCYRALSASFKTFCKILPSSFPEQSKCLQDKNRLVFR